MRRFQGRKQYKGHLCAGYAIKPGFSACGRYIMSGDCDGKLWFWDWKTNKNIRTIKCHDGVLVRGDLRAQDGLPGLKVVATLIY